MFLPPPLKSSAAMRAASTDPIPLVSWKMPEISLSTPTRTMPPDISACARSDIRHGSTTARPIANRFIGFFPSMFVFCPGLRRRHPDRQAFEAAQRVVVKAFRLAGDFDLADLARQ